MGRAARLRAARREPLGRPAEGPLRVLPPAPPAPAAPTREQVVQGLERVRSEREALARRQDALVEDARVLGVGWAELGRALGVTGQAVSQRYGRSAPKGRPPARCHFDGHREYCEGAAVTSRGRIPLCGECSSRASTLTRLPARKLPATRA